MEGFAASVWDLFVHGGPIMVPLLFASVFGLALILERLWVFARAYQNFDHVLESLRPLVLAHDWHGAEAFCQRKGPFTYFAHIYLRMRDHSEKRREDVLRREGSILLARLEKRLRLLAALAQISTLLGLLGTFYFMIYRFHPAAASGGQIQQADFFTAIWESFLSTMFGLVIAIPCMTAFQLLEAHVDTVARQLAVLSSFLEEWRLEGGMKIRPEASPSNEVSVTPDKYGAS